MSRIMPTVVACPRCKAEQAVRLFESLNGDRIPAQAQLVLDGTFEQATCTACSAVFRPEHHMLYSQFKSRIWIVMYPVSARGDYAALERSVVEIMARNFEEAPPAVIDGLRGARPRLVFGQHGLTEALRAAREAIDPPLLECTKLLAVQRNLAAILPYGPCELVFERIEAGQLVFGIHALATPERLGELTVPVKLLGETRSLMPEFENTHPDLFQQPFVSALRYLYAGTAELGRA